MYGYTHKQPNNFLSCLSLLLLCGFLYSREVLLRKDFIQANMVYRESQMAEYMLENILPKSVV